MRTVLIIDTNSSFVADIERNMIINEYQIRLEAKSNIDEAINAIAPFGATELVVSGNLLNSLSWKELNIQVFSYARNNSELLTSENLGIPCYGVIKRAGELLELIIAGKTVQFEEDDAAATSVLTSGQLQTPSKEVSFETNAVQTEQNTYSPEVIQMANYYGMTPEQYMEWYKQYCEWYWANALPQPQAQQPQIQIQPEQQVKQPQVQQQIQTSGSVNEYAENQVLADNNGWKGNVLTSDMRTNLLQKKTAETVADKQFEDDFSQKKEKAKCITVYSAKGGVGKTTIACELATFLALTSKGKDNYKVCIADFNIDFGDVLNTLSFDPSGANMTTWATDIKSRIDAGENPQSINYSFEKITAWLQKGKKDGLYALLAPLTNADSMNIGEQEIKVMLRNLIENCGFDFVICDTGNNTRDSSFIALEMADEILLVLTQSINTANCNNSFLATVQRIGFDMNKFRLIINKVKPAKLVGIAAEELETAFINPQTNHPYNFQCYGKIKDDDDITSACNYGEPLVYNSSHEFTRSIGGIVNKILKKQSVLRQPEKKRSLFWKKGK